LPTLIDQLKKDLGEGKVYAASEVPDVEVVSTGSVSLDFATGIGGFPRGTLVEVFGPESIGKTTLSYYMIAEEQKKGRYCAFVNLEGRFNADWAAKVAGVNLEDLLVVSPDPGTEAVEVLAKLVNSGAIGLVVFDSIGAMMGDREQEAGEKKQAGGQSALVTHMVKLASVPAWRNRCTVVFLNQVRDVFGAAVPMMESPGGHSLKHMAVMRIQLKPTRDKIYSIVNGEKKEVGYRVAAFVKKNKLAPPKQVANWQFVHDEVDDLVLGIDRDQEILDLSMRLGIIQRAGAYYSHPLFPDKIQGKEATQEFIKTHPEVMEQLKVELMNIAQQQPEGTEHLVPA
jgi:recombination protein RecA